MSQAPISPLRRRMIEDMTVRGFGERRKATISVKLRSSQSSLAARRIRRSLKICASISCINASRACSRHR